MIKTELDVTNHGNGLASTLKPTKAVGDESKSATIVSSPLSAKEGIKVSLSGAGLQKASGSSGKDRDIDESGLPTDIKQILKMIRKLQRQIAE
ncbi:hypothetical protein [Pseudomonas sp. SDO55104_S430]